jgi:hypothetical protein
MSTSCAEFRVLLEGAQAGGQDARTVLVQDAHARTCAACRAQLARELALDRLLAEMPVPAAPVALARSVLAALAEERARPAPAAEARAADPLGEDLGEFEALLGELPAPRIPGGLSERVLAGVAHARPPRPRRRPRWLLAVAASVAAVALWSWNASRGHEARLEVAQGEPLDLEQDAELLAYAVERWELLHDEDLDVWLASLDPLDELLLEYAGDETWPEDGETIPARTEGD